jgi:hypothetical protein
VFEHLFAEPASYNKQVRHYEQAAGVTNDSITISAGSRMRAAMILAIIADVLQLAVMPFFVEGVESPAEDLLDLGVAVILVRLLGWHWEFLPSFAAKLMPGIDLVPFWTLAVINVYRKSKRAVIVAEASRQNAPRERNAGGA